MSDSHNSKSDDSGNMPLDSADVVLLSLWVAIPLFGMAAIGMAERYLVLTAIGGVPSLAIVGWWFLERLELPAGTSFRRFSGILEGCFDE